MAFLSTANNDTAYPDTAATGHFVPPNCPGTAVDHNPMTVQCANNTNMQSIATVELDIPNLPTTLKTATVFREMTKPLFLIPLVCDGGMEVTFCKHDMIVKNKNNQIILTGVRDTQTPLWLIPIATKHIRDVQPIQERSPAATTHQ
jgi:hypothetical protein